MSHEIRKRLKELELERPSRLVKLIERLLADERERWHKIFRDYPALGGNSMEPERIKESMSSFLRRVVEIAKTQEREKVREMCAIAVQKPGKDLRDLLKVIEESCGPGGIDAETERVRLENRADELDLVAAGIRQLDLTKELAPSSTEEE